MTARNYPACLAFTLKYEGGKSNDPRDPGGRTNQGVTQRVYDAYRRKLPDSLRTVYEMTAPERDAIYRTGYWDKVRGDYLRAGEDLCVFDFAVNSGPARARDVWYRCGGPNGLLDGVIHKICAHRLSFLHALRVWSHFGGGWGRRVAACEALAVRMAHGSGAKQVLIRESAAAARDSGKKVSQGSVATSVSGGAALANHANSGNSMLLIAAGIIIAAILLVFIFNAWRQRQRAEAFAGAAKEIGAEEQAAAAKAEALKAQQNAPAAKMREDAGTRF